MADRKYPEGIRIFSPRQGAPDFLKGSILITPNVLFKWLKENANLLTEYNGEKQINLDLLDGNKGLYVAVNTYQKDATKQNNQAGKPKDGINNDDPNDLPF